MITLYDFHAMGINKKVEALWRGVYLAERQEASYFIQLYNLESFYAEVFYDQKKNVIIKIRGFKSTRLLAPYLKGIGINF